MKRLLLLLCLVFISLISQAQIFKHLSIADGLSHRHVYSIKQDSKGYMWFLTHEGADRFNGTEYKHYNFYQEKQRLNTSVNLKSLFHTPDSILWQIGTNGQVFRYYEDTDQFELVYTYPNDPDQTTILDFGIVDNQGHVWMGNKGNIQIFNYKKKKPVTISQHPLYGTTSVTELGELQYAIGTNQGVYLAEIQNDSLILDNSNGYDLLKKLPTRIVFLYYHKQTGILVITTLTDGIYTYDLKTKKLGSVLRIKNTTVNQITSFSDSEVLVATSGAGVYKIDLRKNKIEPYITADYTTYDGMNGNNIRDIYIDPENQIWMANYPTGITVCQINQSNYTWFKHILNKEQSLIHDEVSYIMEDQSGDIWFATTNGISVYNPATNRWKNYLSSYDPNISTNFITNHMFISLSEVKPNIIWAGGYNSGIYEINKITGNVKLITENYASDEEFQPDRNIKAIFTASDHSIWIGGQFNLRQVDYQTKNIRFYNDLSLVTSIEEKDKSNIWVGTAKGLFLLNKLNGKSHRIQLPNHVSHINSLSQSSNGDLFIGTNEGLFILSALDGTFKHFHKENSQIISNNIRTIINDKEGKYVYFTYEKAIGRINLETSKARNWTSDQGLPLSSFSQNCGLQLKSGYFIFGSADGAIMFKQDYEIPEEYRTKLVFEDLEVNQNKIRPSGDDHILSTTLDNTSKIKLTHNQNNFSIKVASINYRYPSNISYSWLMDGLYDDWSRPSDQNKFNFTNLSTGTYTFKVKAISNEDNSTLEERTLTIVINPPFWWSIYAKIIYLLLLGIVTFVTIRVLTRRYRRQVVDSAKQFYYNTAHDTKTPLQIIKEPLQEIIEKEELSKEGERNLRIILRNVNELLAINNSVINYERMEQNEKKLFLSEHSLRKFVENIIDQCQSIAELKQIEIKPNYSIANKDVKVWFDKKKIITILTTLINDATNRSEDLKEITVTLTMNALTWKVAITYTGEPITSEHLRCLEQEDSINEAIHNNSSDGVNEIGLSLACKLIQIHKGELSIETKEGLNTITVNFPIYSENTGSEAITDSTSITESIKQEVQIPVTNINTPEVLNPFKPTVLIVEDDETLIQEIASNLKDQYNISISHTGKEALEIAQNERPEIIISKMSLSDMKGTELSWRIKSNIETSHIFVVLLTDSNNEKHILKGLENGADEFILKPFNYRILKASMVNLLANKERLKDKFANLELQEQMMDCVHCSTNLDWKFIATVKEAVEEHMADPDFNIDKLCSILNMSRTSFYNKLKDLTDQSPSDFIRFIKLKNAANLLISTDKNIAEVAEMTGFNDPKYFREVFKKHFNTTPSKYAKDNK